MGRDHAMERATTTRQSRCPWTMHCQQPRTEYPWDKVPRACRPSKNPLMPSPSIHHPPHRPLLSQPRTPLGPRCCNPTITPPQATCALHAASARVRGAPATRQQALLRGYANVLGGGPTVNRPCAVPCTSLGVACRVCPVRHERAGRAPIPPQHAAPPLLGLPCRPQTNGAQGRAGARIGMRGRQGQLAHSDKAAQWSDRSNPTAWLEECGIPYSHLHNRGSQALSDGAGRAARHGGVKGDAGGRIWHVQTQNDSE